MCQRAELDLDLEHKTKYWKSQWNLPTEDLDWATAGSMWLKRLTQWVCDDNDGGGGDKEDSEDSGDSDDGDDDYDTKFWQIEDGSVGSPSAAQDPAFPPDWNPFWSPAATIFLPQNCWWRFSAVFLAILLSACSYHIKQLQNDHWASPKLQL